MAACSVADVSVVACSLSGSVIGLLTVMQVMRLCRACVDFQVILQESSAKSQANAIDGL